MPFFEERQSVFLDGLKKSSYRLEFDFDTNAPELVRRDPWLVLGQKVGEDPNAMEEA